MRRVTMVLDGEQASELGEMLGIIPDHDGVLEVESIVLGDDVNTLHCLRTWVQDTLGPMTDEEEAACVADELDYSGIVMFDGKTLAVPDFDRYPQMQAIFDKAVKAGMDRCENDD